MSVYDRQSHDAKDSRGHQVAMPSLFARIEVGGLTLPSRIVMAPMTRCRAGVDGTPTPLMATYYQQRASAALIVTEATQVSPQGVGYLGTPGIHDDQQMVAWRSVVDAVHARGGRIFLQLWHVGRVSHPLFQPGHELPVAPSAIAPDGIVLTAEGPKPFVAPRALETREIKGVVDQFRRGAERALGARFDGVEIHAANGYLIDQFLRDGTNRRGDRYGSSLANRIRFLVEVTEAVGSVWGHQRVGVRVSPTGTFNSMSDSDPLGTFVAAATALDAYELAYLHLVADTVPTGALGRGQVTAAIRRAYRGRLIVNGGYDRARAETAIATGRADLVSFGALYIANPDLPERFARQSPLNAPDAATFYSGEHLGYTDYATLVEPVGCVSCAP